MEYFEIAVIIKERVFNVWVVKNVVHHVLKHVIVAVQHRLNHVLMHVVQNDQYVTREFMKIIFMFYTYSLSNLPILLHVKPVVLDNVVQ
jgi:hypothetical protein